MADAQVRELVSRLADKMAHRKCTTMATMLQNAVDKKEEDKEIQKILGSEYFARIHANSYRGQNASQDAVQELVELIDFYISEPVPDAIGEMLVRRIDFRNNATKQIPIVSPAVAEATGRGKPSRGRGSRRKYVKVHPDQELESHESWDENHVEDAEWDVAAMEAKEISTALDRKTSKAIIDALVAIPAAQTNGGANYAANQAGTWTFEDMVDMRTAMKNKYVTPKVMVLNYSQSADLVKSEVFQDSRRYGDFVNKAEGYLGMALGMDIYETNEIADGTVLMLDPDKTLAFGVRRYKMLDSYKEYRDGKPTYGMCISTKYDLQVMSGVFYKRCENA